MCPFLAGDSALVDLRRVRPPEQRPAIASRSHPTRQTAVFSEQLKAVLCSLHRTVGQGEHDVVSGSKPHLGVGDQDFLVADEHGQHGTAREA